MHQRCFLTHSDPVIEPVLHSSHHNNTVDELPLRGTLENEPQVAGTRIHEHWTSDELIKVTRWVTVAGYPVTVGQAPSGPS